MHYDNNNNNNNNNNNKRPDTVIITAFDADFKSVYVFSARVRVCMYAYVYVCVKICV